MKIYKIAITSQAMYGRIPQQLPYISIGSEPEIINIPNDWVMFLSNKIFRKPRVDAIQFLTLKGFKANEKEIKEAYIKGMPGRGQNRTDWEYYKSNVLSWYEDIKKANQDEITRIKLNANKKITQLESFLKYATEEG